MKRIIQLSLLAIIFNGITSCDKNKDMQPAVNEVNEKSATVGGNYNIVPNEVIVKFREGTTESRKLEVLLKVEGKVKEKVLTKMMEKEGKKEGITLLSVPGSTSAAIEMAKGFHEVEYAEPNYIYTHDAVSNDTYYTNSSLWGMYGASTKPANTYGSHAAEAWAAGHTGSSTVYVGIIDEGYMYTHEDLAANAGVNPGEIPGNNKDDDGNGLVDDVYGWDFNSNDNSVFDGTTDDHGTHVAGTIGAVGGNGKGVAGVCWNVKLISAKFLGTRGGTTANAIKAIDYITDLKTRYNLNLVATNNSWGGGGFSQALQDAIERANKAGILFIAAAGNSSSNNDSSPNYPSNYPNGNVIAVASINSDGTLSYFSNYGATSVDIGAPGAGIWSSVPVKSGKLVVSGYASYSGTSMATPHVTGAAALYAATHAGTTPALIKSAILGAAMPTASLSGKCNTGGRLDVSTF